MADQELIIRINGNAKKFTDAIDKAEKRVENFTSSLASVAKVSSAAFVGLATAVGGTVARFSSFEKSFTNVVTLLDKGSFSTKTLEKGISDLRNEVLALGAKSGESFENLNKGLFDLISAGVPAERSMQALAAATELAIAGATTTDVAVKALSASLTAFGDSAGTADEIAQKFFTAQKFGVTTVEALATSFNKVAGISKELGISFDETLASLSSLTANGAKPTQQAATELRAALNAIILVQSKLKNESAEVQDALSLQNVRQRGLVASLDLLKKATGGNVVEIQRLLGSQEALAPVLSLTGAQSELVAKQIDEIGNASQRALTFEEALAVKQNTVDQAFKRLKTGVDAAAITFGEVFAPTITAAANALTAISKNLSSLDKETIQTIGTITKFALLITGSAAVAATLALAYIKIGIALGAFNALLVENGIVISANTIKTSAATAAQAAWNFVLGVGDKIIGVFTKSVVLMGSGIASVARFLNPLTVIQRSYNAALIIGNGIQRAYAAAIVLTRNGLINAILAMTNFNLATTATSIAQRAAAIATNLFSGALNFMKIAIRGVVGATGIGLLLVGLSLLIQNMDKVQAVASGTFAAIAEATKTFAQRAGNILSAFGQLLGNIFTLNFSDVKSSFDKLKLELSKSLSEIGENAGKAYNDAYKKSIESANPPEIKEPEAPKFDGTGSQPKDTPAGNIGDLIKKEQEAASRLREIRARENELTKAQAEQASRDLVEIKDAELKKIADEENRSNQERIKIKQDQLQSLKRIDELEKANAELSSQQKLSTIKQAELEANKEELELLKQKFEESRALESQHNELVALEQAERDLAKLERIEAQAEEEAALREQINELAKEQRDLLDEEDLLKFQEQIQTKREIEKEVAAEQLADNISRRKQFIKDELKFGTEFAKLKEFFSSQELQLANQTAGQLVQLTQSKNAQLKSIGKAAALVQIGIKTAEGAISAYSALAGIPIVGPALGAVAAAALIAFGVEQASAVTSAQRGGIVPNGQGGSNDRIPALLQPGELVVPTPLAPDFIQAVGRPDPSSGAGGGRTEVVIGFTDDAIPFIEQKLLQRRAIGTGSL